MRYSKVIYRDFLQPNAEVLLGVIVQDDNGITTKFDLTPLRFEQVKNISPKADWDTFRLFDVTFKKGFLDKGAIITSDHNGKKKLTIKDPSFLEYLHEKFQNNYQIEKPEEIDNPNKIVDLLVSFGS